jgi:hypothetical protein
MFMPLNHSELMSVPFFRPRQLLVVELSSQGSTRANGCELQQQKRTSISLSDLGQKFLVILRFFVTKLYIPR